MRPGDYRIQVHILEAKDIKAAGKAGGLLSHFEGETADPMVEVEVLGQSKCTDYKPGTLNPNFNEMLFFNFDKVKQHELETAMISISLFDHDFVGSNNLIGKFTVDIAYIYRMNQEHELYRMWVALTDPADETSEIKAFLRITINVLGPGDKPPVHDPLKHLVDRNDNGVNKLFTPSRVKLTGHIIKLAVYRAEHLAPLDLAINSVDPYVKVSFAGTKAESKTVSENRNPEFNQELQIACKLPTMNNQIKIEVWDDDLLNDERVGTHYINFNEVRGKQSALRWINLYGPPLLPGDVKNEYADLMTLQGDKGSTYRGRLLYSLSTEDSENPKTKTRELKYDVRANRPSPNVKVKSYMLKVALYQGVELPNKAQGYYVIATCGPYEVVSQRAECVNSRATWNQYLELNIRAPETQEDIPDVILYLADDPIDPMARYCFKRLKAASLLDVNGKDFKIDNVVLEEDKAIDALDDEQFPGILQTCLKLYTKEPSDDFAPTRFKQNETAYLLLVHLFMGREFPPADETGAADPFVIARCQGKKAKSDTRFETLNPGFFQTLEMVVSLPPLNDPEVSSLKMIVDLVSNAWVVASCLRPRQGGL